MPVVPRVAIFCNDFVYTTFNTSDNPNWMANGFEVHHFNNQSGVRFLKKLKIGLVISIGPKNTFKYLNDIHLQHFNFSNAESITGDLLYHLYFTSSVKDNNPTISIFTPAYNTFDKFDRVYRSMCEQSFKDWEWVIVDDSPDERNYNYICSKVVNDDRVKVYKSNKQEALVGATKRQAASLCSGEYLLELDHDDELHHLALEIVVSAFKKYPDAGFCYTDCVEKFETGGCVNYGSYYALGFGSHYLYYYNGEELIGSSTPINASTIRHIVGAPNHIRCWKRDVYFELGRHNNKFAVVDDYELIVRTFLKTKMIHIPEVLYIQYMNAGGNNTQEPRRAEIQRLVMHVQQYYDKQIHERILELGGQDWLWDENLNRANLNISPPNERSELAYVYKV